MARVLRFYTAAFDVTKERPNPVNPIPGESLLLWLIERAKDAVEISAPASEDWILQIDKHRSLKEKLLGRAKMTQDDECAQYFQGLLEREASFRRVSSDPEP